jgi:hypothetical protein
LIKKPGCLGYIADLEAMGRERYRNDVLDCASAYQPISRVDAGGRDAHEYLASGGFGIFNVFVSR